MNERQKNILSFVINEYIRSAQPIGSALLSEKAGMDLSPATYRNELAVLEKEGFLTQPHTSAGRIPTEKAYQYFVDTLMTKKSYQPKDRNDLKLSIKRDLDQDQMLKDVAKQLVEKSDQAVIVAFDKNTIFYTGLSHLFSQPEFSQQSDIISLTSVVDDLDEVIGGMFDNIQDLEILVGSHNPFGRTCSSILGKYKMKDDREGMFAILGPMRMDYEKNIHLLQEVKQLLEKTHYKEE